MGACLDFCHISLRTWSATILSVDQDLSSTAAFTAAGIASTPGMPISQNAIDRKMHSMASFSGAFHDLFQRLLATKTSIEGFLCQGSAPFALPTATGRRTSCPFAPSGEFTIHWRTFHTLILHTFVEGRIAGGHFFQAASAKGPGARAKTRDGPLT